HMLSHAIRRIGLDPIELDLDETASKAGFESRQALAIAIGRGRYATKDVLKVAFPGYTDDQSSQVNRVPIEDAAPLFVRGHGLTQGVTIHFAQCCSPLPGERIVGVLRPDQGVEVHTVFCNRLAEFEDDTDQWIDLKWTSAASEDAIGVVRIKVSAANNKGVLATLCNAVAHAEGNIIGVKTGERAPDFIDLYFDIEVSDVKHHINILAAFRTLAVVDSAERILESDFDDR
ncbi:MAG: RelA/SpoT AH/RIS domain-containing protein, partial [Pseudomonadota bacterium]